MDEEINGVIVDGKVYTQGDHTDTCLYCAFIGEGSECNAPCFIRCESRTDTDWQFSKELTERLNAV